MDQIRAEFDAVFLGLGAQSGRAAAMPGQRGAERRHRHRVPAGLQRRPHAHVGKRVVVVGGGDTSIDVATVARRLGHIEQAHEQDRPEYAIAGHAAHDVAAISAKQGAEVTLDLGVRHRQDAGEQARNRAGTGRRHRDSRRSRPGHGGARCAGPRHGAARGEMRGENSSGRKLEIKIVEGTEEDIPADLIVSAVGQAVDFTGLEEFNNGKGAVVRGQELPGHGQEGVFVGGDIVRPHLLTTAIGHGSIAADGIDRFLRNEAPEKRPKIDVHQFDLIRKMMEKGLKIEETHEPLWRHRWLQRRRAQLRQPIRPARHHA